MCLRQKRWVYGEGQPSLSAFGLCVDRREKWFSYLDALLGLNHRHEMNQCQAACVSPSTTANANGYSLSSTSTLIAIRKIQLYFSKKCVSSMLKSGHNIRNLRWKVQKPKIHVKTKLCHVNDGHNSVQLQYPDYLLSLRPNTEGMFHMKIPTLQNVLPFHALLYVILMWYFPSMYFIIKPGGRSSCFLTVGGITLHIKNEIA